MFRFIQNLAAQGKDIPLPTHFAKLIADQSKFLEDIQSYGELITSLKNILDAVIRNEENALANLLAAQNNVLLNCSRTPDLDFLSNPGCYQSLFSNRNNPYALEAHGLLCLMSKDQLIQTVGFIHLDQSSKIGNKRAKEWIKKALQELDGAQIQALKEKTAGKPWNIDLAVA